ncbi:tyrosine-type recombinase/integrase [Sinorhizobium medicae]|uniref:tyrosine-type recombinase/integrase n=1 Tax=Sinorhizobium medicae TaxID=110321 RepID=UPI001297B573|nr:site-specific integrase [Sinorhizobium medicae]MQV48261.1 tyrosine-type recombinase/integrase [Sinorhizobium medicae]MQV53873.1 tyrosine-type recombinase/integrase [Sinorhizobium medicae]MQV71519.1 tyrosine-type recombinase/integrase [Sinorhizobium medicae]
MARNLLTVTEIKNSSKPKLRDGDGLWLHTSSAGNRHFVFIYIRHGRRREMGLGTYGTGTGQVSLAAARAKAEEIRAILGRGGDPFTEMEERQEWVKPTTFGQCADDLVDAMESQWRNEKHRAQWRMTLTEYAKALRKMPVAEVTTDDVVRVLKPIWTTKAETASRLRGRIEKVLDHAKVRGLRTGENPARWKGHLDHILPKAGKLKRGHHAAMPYADVPAFMKKIREASGVGARALEFTVLTASRTGETMGARWAEFDFKENVWTVPAERMKGGREHRVPLTDRVLAVLTEMQKRSVNDFVFPGSKANTPISNMTMSKVMKTYEADAFTVHGFRSAFRDWASEETDFQGEVAEAALAHITGDETERAYRRGDVLEKRRKLMEAWETYCEAV